MRRALPSRLMFVADASHAPEGLAPLVARAVAAGAAFLELRRPVATPDPGSRERLAEITACLREAPGAVVLVNDRVDLALLSGAHGAHVGQDDLPPEAARQLLGPERWLGLSTHDLAQVRAAQRLPLDYVAVGPVFESPTKRGHAPVLGLEGLAACAAASDLPVVAIGGITADNAASVLASGAACVAMASAVAVGDVAANVGRIMEATSR